MLALQLSRCFPQRICFQYLMMKDHLQRINKCTYVYAPARQNHLFQMRDTNVLCVGKQISDRLEVTQGFIFQCHFYLRFFTVLPCSQQLQFGTLILDFIVYFPQCSLHQTDKRHFYKPSILNVLISHIYTVLELKPKRKWVTSIQQCFFF